MKSMKIEYVRRISETTSIMRDWDEFSLAQLIGRDLWDRLSPNDRRDLGRQMRTVLEYSFPKLKVVPEACRPVRYRIK